MSTTPPSLDQSLAFEQRNDSTLALKADERFEANTGMFGGWTAALALKAASSNELAAGSPSALTVNYINRIVPGSALVVTRRQLGASKSLQHWQLEILEENTEKLLACASVVLANRVESDDFLELEMPKAPPAQSLQRFVPPGSFAERTQIKTIEGFPPFGQANTRSLAWVSEYPEHPLDSIRLAYLADAYPPRIWYRGKTPRPSATLTMSVYFHCSDEKLASCGTGNVLLEAQGTIASESTVASKGNLWSEEGSLLATTEQLSWFK
jgi:acyl-CoA thioesterase